MSPAGSNRIDLAALAADILAGNRRALARGITLVESTRLDHREAADALIRRVLPETGRGMRLGITGTPGVGKSTFIEAFGQYLIGLGHKVAVLAVDPSSARSGGSILGDKTRMAELVKSPSAFVRPSPARGTVGGVARRTREAMLLVEAAGYDLVLVETVGVGQAETAVADMVDMFLLLLAPGGGDELQGIKRGIMELADLVVVNKADGDLGAAARSAAAEYRGALRLLRPKSPAWQPQVTLISALNRSGIDTVWRAVQAYRQAMETGGELSRRRADQAKAWMWSELRESLVEALKDHPAVVSALPRLESEVAAGRISPSAAAAELLQRFRGN